jgi:hypothetical protein
VFTQGRTLSMFNKKHLKVFIIIVPLLSVVGPLPLGSVMPASWGIIYGY